MEAIITHHRQGTVLLTQQTDLGCAGRTLKSMANAPRKCNQLPLGLYFPSLLIESTDSIIMCEVQIFCAQYSYIIFKAKGKT